jgi:hypothetical protein
MTDSSINHSGSWKKSPFIEVVLIAIIAEIIQLIMARFTESRRHEDDLVAFWQRINESRQRANS